MGSKAARRVPSVFKPLARRRFLVDELHSLVISSFEKNENGNPPVIMPKGLANGRLDERVRTSAEVKKVETLFANSRIGTRDAMIAGADKADARIYRGI
jgi:hypothetical protein